MQDTLPLESSSLEQSASQGSLSPKTNSNAQVYKSGSLMLSLWFENHMCTTVNAFSQMPCQIEPRDEEIIGQHSKTVVIVED